ncbi:MAG: TRAP transporter small permease [Chloroflexota bacterium]
MRQVYRLVRWVAIVLFVLLVSTVFASVSIRYLGILSGSIDWAEEAARFLFIWTCFLGTALAFDTGSHVRIDIIERFLPFRGRTLLAFVVELLVIAFALLVTVYGFELTTRTVDQISLVLKIPMAVVHAVVPLSGIVILAGALHRAVGHVTALRTAGGATTTA